MPTLEDVLGSLDTIELTGASGVCGGLTMGRNKATGRRAFRLVVEDTIEQTISLAHIDHVFLEMIDIVGYSEPKCQGSVVCNVSNADFGYDFGDPDGAPGQARTYPPVGHDDRAVQRMLDDCDCGTSNDRGRVRSLKFYFTVKFIERNLPRADDRWARCQFTCCTDCERLTT